MLNTPVNITLVSIMKTTAQLLRESMTAISNAQQAVTESAPEYTFRTTITNPFVDDTVRFPDDENVPDLLDVGVVASIFGRDRPATYNSPAEYAEVEIQGVYDLETGDDITNVVDPQSMKAIEAEAAQYFDEQQKAAADDAAEARYRDMLDRY